MTKREYVIDPQVATAFAWMVMATSQPSGPVHQRLLVAGGQRAFAAMFLRRAANPPSAQNMVIALDERVGHPNLPAADLARVQRLRRSRRYRHL